MALILGIIDVQYDAMEWVKFTISYNFPLQSQKSILGEIIWKVEFKKTINVHSMLDWF